MFLMLVGFASIGAYAWFFIHYMDEIFERSRVHPLWTWAGTLFSLSAYAVVILMEFHQLGLLLMMAGMLLTTRFMYRMNRVQRLYASTVYVFAVYSSRGIIVSIFAIVQHESIGQVLSGPYYYPILTLSVLLSLTLNRLLRLKLAPDDLAKHLVNNSSQLLIVSIFLLTQTFYLLLINNGRFLSLSEHYWFSVLYIASCLISKAGFVVIIYHTLKVSLLLHYERQTFILQEQLTRQVNHYQSYQEFTKSFRNFKHDYIHMMGSVKTFLNAGEQEKAVQLMDDIYDTMQKTVHIHKTYSNHVMLDAVLQDAANACKCAKIVFSATLHLPERLPLSDLGMIRLFTNLLSNGVEACAGMEPTADRFLHVNGFTLDEWIYVEVTNSFNGHLKQINGKLATTKSNGEFHGMGLTIVADIVRSVGGFILIEPDFSKFRFVVKLHIPLATEKV